MPNLIFLALAFTALFAFVTAHTTIVTTTTIHDQDPSITHQCSQQLQGQRFHQCGNYVLHNQGIEQCCNELGTVDGECQCAAIKQAYNDAQQEVQQQQGQKGKITGYQHIEKLIRKRAQKLPNKCNLQTACQIGTITATTTSTTTKNVCENPGRQSSQECRQIVQQESFNQCQMYIAQVHSRGTLLMSINKQGHEAQLDNQCCNELKSVREECQCEAMKEVYRKLTQQRSHQFGGQEQQMEVVQRIIQNLPDQCDLEVEQCHIPSEMF